MVSKWYYFLFCIIVLLGAFVAYTSFRPESIEIPTLTPPVAESDPQNLLELWRSGKVTAPIPPRRPEPEVPDGWKKYANFKYGFSVYTPEALVVSEINEGNDTYTITFQNVETTEGFQIYATPYTLDFISESRLKQDLPSGIVTNQAEVLIDGERATAFFSVDARMGETREVWFIYDDVLYEVTTLRAHDQWLAQIMSTWRFRDKF